MVGCGMHEPTSSFPYKQTLMRNFPKGFMKTVMSVNENFKQVSLRLQEKKYAEISARPRRKG